MINYPIYPFIFSRRILSEKKIIIEVWCLIIHDILVSRVGMFIYVRCISCYSVGFRLVRSEIVLFVTYIPTNVVSECSM